VYSFDEDNNGSEVEAMINKTKVEENKKLKVV
jgi:hypothetical protein